MQIEPRLLSRVELPQLNGRYSQNRSWKMQTAHVVAFLNYLKMELNERRFFLQEECFRLVFPEDAKISVEPHGICKAKCIHHFDSITPQRRF